jgi:uncharacterized protein (TIGR03086 family)
MDSGGIIGAANRSSDGSISDALSSDEFGPCGPSNDAMTEIADRYRRVAAGFTERVHAVPDDAWSNPAPCDGWVTRDIVRHLVEWVPAFIADAGGPHIPAGASVDDDPVGAWDRFDRAVQSLLADPDQSATVLHHPHVGEHRLDDAINTFVLGDVLVHTWDLARAAGLDESLDHELVHEMLVGIEPMDAVLRSSGQYGPRVEVPAESDEQTRLIAFTGREP